MIPKQVVEQTSLALLYTKQLHKIQTVLNEIKF